MSEDTVDKDALLLQGVVDGIKYSFLKDVLVKPMPVTMVMKTITSQVPTQEVDEDGIAMYDTKVEDTEVESNYREGIVLVLPETGNDGSIKVGDKVVYAKRHAIDFDLFKDSQLIKLYDIVAINKI